MASAQAFGTLNNLQVLEGHSPDEIIGRFSGMALKKSLEYSETLSVDLHLGKLKLAEITNEVFLNPETKKHGP